MSDKKCIVCGCTNRTSEGVFVWGLFCMPCAQGIEHNHANAQLIAAAPALLAAAKAAHEVLMAEGACATGGPRAPGEPCCEKCALARQLRVAVALAEDGPR